ncbi:hypothetical protein GCM10011583_31610 [Streptomyces camponoticapitis]|uniref:Uncharacterized protein n=1 Tax=Streptomyces camponoticapitis TaxID=1616125 RepID=A0ABQ2E6C8_9ACTN|nr:hypothetical protein GCM10011583_31610 [Streptomyces camponoticapitis]
MLFKEFWRTVRQAIACPNQTVRLITVLLVTGLMLLVGYQTVTGA